jgi:molybdopterin converting factor subunit 1
MKITLRYFALWRELLGRDEEVREVAPGTTVGGLADEVASVQPRLAALRGSTMLMVNQEYAPATTPLGDGDEVAFIPPVSGGGSDRERPMRVLELRDAPFTSAILAELGDRLATDEDGAIVGFLGRTRRSPGTPAPGQEAEAARHASRSVDSLEYEAHEAMVARVLDAIADEIAERFGVERVAIVHRTGDVPLGEISIAVVAVAPHRDAAFQAARYGIDETKARAPIWKAERFADGHVWVGEPARSEAPPSVPAGGHPDHEESL